ncbi:chromosome segregation protein SMC [Halalkalibacillus sediminis]|uniref:Chromosome partition protein Smc n=1 Tax=Halalkalibacillus sediminis TaxID=2018042 RepID=A0A2I0QW74_9BACI|nr:chromosome segregation protein SMC [Halalkalibacillus sediminis]PKR78591.1 chromosome segregation protein SMC [Halalkalibacillus sediminis]
MFLKKLDSVGFKSFAERISVDFVPGVTAVVGPNGSGKSNITDAIRWVLGEQSAKSLRGSKMQDIIFAGSDSRKALNVAEVTLVLDNKDQQLPIDYEEVAVTRRVYRSGDSEYLLNKQPCRLKDIVDLFMDSGLGKEAFSIISQGKVEEILSSKSEERRSIFEEAAGVLKYKQRKIKAVKKLTETEENLNRVEDIIHEIDGQLEPLKEQAAIAKDYLEKKEELERFEVSLIVSEIEQIHNEWQEVLSSIERLKEELVEQKSFIEKDEHQVEKYGHSISELDEKIESWQEEKLSLTQLIEQVEGKKNVLTERLKHFDESKSKLDEDILSKQDHIEQLTFDFDDLTKRLQILESSRAETKQSIKELESEIEDSGSSVEERIESLKAEYIEILNEQAANKNEKASVQRQIEQAEHRKERLDERFKQMLSERDEIESDRESREENRRSAKAEIKSKQEQVAAKKSEIEDIQPTINEDEEKLQKGYRMIEQLRSKKEMLEDMKHSYSGFFYGVKSLLQAQENNKVRGLHGAVAQLINVPNDYVSAIETALGGQAQHLVVDTDEDARNAIQYLKKSNSGRATLLPMKTIRGRSVDQNSLNSIKGQNGFVGVASDLVEFDGKYESIVKSLLGHILIAESLKDANQLAKLCNHRYRIVTLDGDVVNPGGSMSGGAKKNTNQASLFTRDQELEEIKEKLDDYENKSESFASQLQKKKENLAERRDELENLEAELSTLTEEHHESDNKYQALEMKLSSLNDQLSVYDQENSQYEKEIEDLNTQLTNLTEKLVEQDTEADELKKNIDDLSNNQSTFKEAQEEYREKINHLQIRLAEQDSDIRNQKENVRQAEEELSEQKQQKDNLEQELKALEESHENSQTIEQLGDQLKEARTRLVNVNDQLEQSRNERREIQQAREDLERELKENNRSYDKKNSELQQLEVKANRQDVELDNRLNRLSEEYETTFEKAKAEFGVPDDLQATKEKVKLIKRSIDELGTVNLGSIEEYERIQERYDFLTGQQNDLLEAKATLNEIIDEMDGEMVRKFSHTFEQIQQQFSQVFVELFGGGSAELKLTDPDNLLETGVDIVAQPPGKKLQHLSLLSGGERALTAIALLFAILRVRPVPFCVLDEVEAALDEANVVRFAQYLKEFSQQTQFIVITHRKGTMELADVLYGVTMQESGVSKLVSVKLEETEEMIYS